MNQAGFLPQRITQVELIGDEPPEAHGNIRLVGDKVQVTLPAKTQYRIRMTIQPRTALTDEEPPSISEFSLKPRTEEQPITINWEVNDNKNLKRIELWRTPAGQNNWVEVDQGKAYIFQYFVK